MTKKVLYISYDGMTDPLGQSQVLPYLCGLSKLGYPIFILSFEKENRLEQEGHIVRRIMDDNSLTWIPLSFTSQPPVIAKLYDRYRLKRKAIELHELHNFSLIHCRSYLAAEAGMMLKKKYGIPFIFDMRGFWADEKIDTGYWNRNKFLYSQLYDYYKKKEIEFLSESASVISLTEAARKEIRSWNSFRNLTINVIPCCADLSHFDFHEVSEQQKAEVRIKLGLSENDKVLVYVGTFGHWYLSDEMLRFFYHLIQADDRFILVIYSNDNVDELYDKIESHKIPKSKARILYIPRQELPAYLSIAEFSMYFLRNTYSKIASSPTRHGELMGMGIPIVCNDVGDTGYILEQSKSGVLVASFDDQAMKEAVTRILAYKPNKEHIRKEAIKFFDLRVGIEKYATIYRQILENAE